MKYQQIYTKQALEDLRALPKPIAQRIVDKIEFYAMQNHPLLFAKRLTDLEAGQYRFRIGDYRAIFDMDQSGNIKILLILKIKHRKEIYRN